MSSERWKTSDLSHIKWTYKEVITIFHYQTLVTWKNIKTYRNNKIKILETTRIKNLSCMMDLILYQIFRSISNISKSMKH